MGDSDYLWEEQVKANRTREGTPRKPNTGSMNFLRETIGTALIVDPEGENVTPDGKTKTTNRKNWLDLMHHHETTGHLAKHQGTEQGSPGMHASMNFDPALGVLKWALVDRDNGKTDQELIEATLRDIERQIGFDRKYAYKGSVYQPAPRIKIKSKNQVPWDGIRDNWLELATTGKLDKKDSFWEEEQNDACRTLRDLLAMDPPVIGSIPAAEGQCGDGEEEPPKAIPWVQRFCDAEMPLLYLPIIKTKTEDGGFDAYIEDTEAARKAMQKDCSPHIIVGPEGVRYQVDWTNEWREMELK